MLKWSIVHLIHLKRFQFNHNSVFFPSLMTSWFKIVMWCDSHISMSKREFHPRTQIPNSLNFSFIKRSSQDTANIYNKYEIKIKGWTRGFPLKVIGILTSWRTSSGFRPDSLSFVHFSVCACLYASIFFCILSGNPQHKEKRMYSPLKIFIQRPNNQEMWKHETNEWNYNQIWRKTAGRLAFERSVLCWPSRSKLVSLVAPRPPAAMASGESHWEEFYLGSRRFQFIADGLGMPIDQVNWENTLELHGKLFPHRYAIKLVEWEGEKKGKDGPCC